MELENNISETLTAQPQPTLLCSKKHLLLQSLLIVLHARIDIDLSRAELPRRCLLCKQNVHLLKSAAPRLGESEISPSSHAESRSRPKEAGLTLQVRSRGVDEIWLKETDDDIHDLVEVAGQDDRLASESYGAGFGNDSICYRANSEGIGENPDQSKGGLGPKSSLRVGCCGSDPDY